MADLGQVGTGSATTAGTTLAVTNTSGAIIPAGTVLVLAANWDNINSVTAPTVSTSAAGGGNWVARLTPPVGSGVTTIPGTGIWHATWSVRTVSDIAPGATITTITSSQSAVKRVATISAYSDCTNTIRGTVSSGTSSAGTPSVATGSPLEIGDVVVGTVATENNAVPTGDAESLNGSWTAITGTLTSGGAANTNLGVGIQSKTLTAIGEQTYSPTGANDSVASIFVLISSTRSVADSAPAIEEVTAEFVRMRFVFDSAPATDAAGSARLSRFTAESAGGSDAVNAVLVPWDGTDARVAWVEFVIPEPISVSADNAPAVDTATQVLTQARAVEDVAAATDEGDPYPRVEDPRISFTQSLSTVLVNNPRTVRVEQDTTAHVDVVNEGRVLDEVPAQTVALGAG